MFLKIKESLVLLLKSQLLGTIFSRHKACSISPEPTFDLLSMPDSFFVC